MGKDLIIGGASNYDWDKLKYWINSIRMSGFAGDVVLVATNMSKETIDKLTSEGVKLELYGQMQEDGSIKAHSNGAPHVERFFYIWNYLNSHLEEYDFVVSTDTRDVVFQSNPSTWIDDCILTGYESLIVSSEGLRYRDEPWSNRNLLETFGPYFHREFQDIEIFNVGVLAGEAKNMCDLFFMIFQMAINRPIPIVDQAVFNVLLRQHAYQTITKFAHNYHGWAIQLGTTIEAVKAGSGDLGAMAANDPTKLILYESTYADEQPIINDDGTVSNHKGDKFVIVHQWDRIPKLAQKIMEKYNEI